MKDGNRIWDFISNNLITLSTIITGIVVIVLQQIGIIGPDQISAAILAILALLATSEIVDKSRKLDRIEDSVAKGFSSTLKAIGNPEVYKFPLIDEGFEYVAKRIREAKFTIDHVGFSPRVPRWSKSNEKYNKAIISILKSNRVKYRYVFILRPSGSQITRTVSFLSDSDIKQYFPACYIQHDESFPAFSFILIDQEELIIYYSNVLGEPEVGLSIRHPDIVQVHSDYFRRLWTDATRLNLKKSIELSQQFPQKD